MPRKTPDEIFKVIKKHESDRQAEVKALQVVLEVIKKRRPIKQKVVAS